MTTRRTEPTADHDLDELLRGALEPPEAVVDRVRSAALSKPPRRRTIRWLVPATAVALGILALVAIRLPDPVPARLLLTNRSGVVEVVGPLGPPVALRHRSGPAAIRNQGSVIVAVLPDRTILSKGALP